MGEDGVCGEVVEGAGFGGEIGIGWEGLRVKAEEVGVGVWEERFCVFCVRICVGAVVGLPGMNLISRGSKGAKSRYRCFLRHEGFLNELPQKVSYLL